MSKKTDSAIFGGLDRKTVEPENNQEVKYDNDFFPVNLIHIGENVRETISTNSVKELAESIKNDGQLQPIVLSKKMIDGKFDLVSGYRRYKAVTEILKQKTIRVSWVGISSNRTALQLIENIQREDLSDIETAKGIKELMKETGENQQGIAKLLSKSKQWVTYRLQYLAFIDKLEIPTSELEKLSVSHVQEILKLPEPERLEIVKGVIGLNLSVMKLREVVKPKKTEPEIIPTSEPEEEKPAKNPAKPSKLLQDERETDTASQTSGNEILTNIDIKTEIIKSLDRLNNDGLNKVLEYIQSL